MWFKLKINPLTFTVSNHLQMEAHPLPAMFSVLLWSGAGAVDFFLSQASLLFVLWSWGGGGSSGANLIKNSTGLNSGKSYEQGNTSNPLVHSTHRAWRFLMPELQLFGENPTISS